MFQNETLKNDTTYDPFVASSSKININFSPTTLSHLVENKELLFETTPNNKINHYGVYSLMFVFILHIFRV